MRTDHAGDLDHRQSEVLEEMGFELDETRNIISHPDDAEATLEANDADRDLYRVRRLKRVYDQSKAVVDLLSRLSLSRLRKLLGRSDNSGS